MQRCPVKGSGVGDRVVRRAAAAAAVVVAAVVAAIIIAATIVAGWGTAEEEAWITALGGYPDGENNTGEADR